MRGNRRNRIRDENRANIERTISQNNRMLKQLESVSYNTQEAAQYARLAADYSRANAYFAQSEVWK